MTAQRRPRARRRDLSDLAGLRGGRYLRVSRADPGDKQQPDAERSTSTQRRISEEWSARVGAHFADEYADPDISASRFAIKKNRPEFERMVADVAAGKLDFLWFWEISRQQRRLDVFANLRNLCRDMNVLWVLRDRVADPANSQDMLLAGIQSMMAEDESEKLSQRVFDGKESSALRGRRAGRFPYGYKRGSYDPVSDTFGPDQPNVFDGDGRPVEDSPAWIVREIFGRLRRADAIYRIRCDLNARGVPAPGGGLWTNSRVRYIATNPAYCGLRTRHLDGTSPAGKILDGVTAEWPPLVDQATFWAVYRTLADPARKTTKPHRPGGRLLSAVARCGVCGGKLTVAKASRTQQDDSYQCRDRACVGIYVGDLDGYVTQVMIRWLSLPETASDLAPAGTSEAAALARADLDRAQAEYKDLIVRARRGGLSAVLAEAMESEILARVEDAKQRLAATEAPPLLRGLLGEHAAAAWAALTVPQRRQVIAQTADIRVHPVGRHGNIQVHPRDRVEWRWLLGPAAGEPVTDPAARIRAHYAARAQRLGDRAAVVMRLRGEGRTRKQIAEHLGISFHTVAKDIARAQSGRHERAAAGVPDDQPVRDQDRQRGPHRPPRHPVAGG